MSINEQSTTQTDDPGEEAERWRKWDEAFVRILKHRADMERRDALLSRDEIDRAIDEMRGAPSRIPIIRTPFAKPE